MATRPGALAGAQIVGERFVRSRRQQNPEGRMPLLDHLRELRNRIVKMALALVAGTTVGFVFFSQAWHVIERPLCSTQRLNMREVAHYDSEQPTSRPRLTSKATQAASADIHCLA